MPVSTRRMLHRRSAARRCRLSCSAGCCGSWSSLPGGRHRVASGKCAPYEWPFARAWPAFAPTVRLAGGGCGTGSDKSAPCCLAGHHRVITAHPAGDTVPPGRPAKPLPAALPRRSFAASFLRYIAAAACTGAAFGDRTRLLHRMFRWSWSCRDRTGMRTAGLLYGAVRGLFAAGTPRSTAAGRSAAPSGTGRRHDAGAALFVKAVWDKGETDGYRACV